MNDPFDEIFERRGTHSLKWEPELFPFQELGKLMPHIEPDPDVIPMWVADMDFAAPKPVMESLQQRLDTPILGYTLRSKEYTSTIAQWFNDQHEWHVDKDWIAGAPSTVAAVCMTIQTYTHPGDKILYQTPAYYPIPSGITSNGRQVVASELIYKEGHYYMDFDDLEKKLSDPRVKMFIFCSPHNPVGRVWTKEELEKVCQLCEKYGTLLVSDEIWCDLTLSGNKHIPVGKLLPNQSIVICGPTKAFNLAALSIAYAVIPNTRLRVDFQNTYLRQGLFFGNSFAETALIACYTKGKEWLQDLLKYIEKNILLVETFCRDNLNNQIKVVKPEASYLIWLDCRALSLSQSDLTDLFMKEMKLWLSPGFTYGIGGDGFMRLNVACPSSRLQEALNRMERVINAKNSSN